MEEYISPLLHADAKSYTTAREFLTRNQSFFTVTLDRPTYTSPAESTPITALQTAAATFTLVPDGLWTIETHRANIAAYIGTPPATRPASDTTITAAMSPEPSPTPAFKALDKAFKKDLYRYLRWALSGGAPGPGIPETLEILGREESVRRIRDAQRLTAPPKAGCRVPKGAGLDKLKEGGNAWMGSLAGVGGGKES